MTGLPPGWAWSTLGEIAQTQLGKMLSAKARSGDGRPYLRNKNVQWGRIDVDDVFRMDFSDKEFEKFRLRDGDLLVCEGGEVGRAAIWRGALAECGYQKALHRVRPLGGVVPEYLLYLLMHYAGSRAFDRFVTGSTIAHLPQEDLRELPVPLPPLAEQRRIVSTIEEQFSRLTAVDAYLDSAEGLLRGLRAQVLRDAFDRDDAPVVEIGSFAHVGSGATPARGRSEYWNGGDIPWVTSGQLAGESVTCPAGFITELAFRETSVKLWPPGTLLVALYGEGRTRGRCAELLFEATTNQACAALVVDESVADRTYVRHFFDANYVANRRLSAGGVQPNLTLGLIRSLQIPLPPIAEQRRIAGQTEDRLASVSRSRNSIRTLKLRRAAFARSLLTSAFRGELVPQDPDDEPASLLLDRIAAERAALPKTVRRRATMKAS